jgi:hypothetical protein
LATGALAMLMGFAVYGAQATVARASGARRFALPMPASDRLVIASLAAHGITLYVSDYWTCYRLAFESDEHVRCAVRDMVDSTLTQNGAVNRYRPYLLAVERAPHPAYIFYAGSVEDRTFDAWAVSQRLPHSGYSRYVIQGYAVYYFPYR